MNGVADDLRAGMAFEELSYILSKIPPDPTVAEWPLYGALLFDAEDEWRRQQVSEWKRRRMADL